jgi:flagellum-specific peptidoglycan hydrolase FlgJ
MGTYSTELFLKRTSGNVESIEMDTEEWYKKIVENFKSYDNWNPILLVGKDEYLKHSF